MRRVVDYTWFNSGIRNNFTGIKFSHPHSYGEHIHKRLVNFTFGKYSLLHSFQGTRLVNTSAIGINTCFNSQCCCFFMDFRHNDGLLPYRQSHHSRRLHNHPIHKFYGQSYQQGICLPKPVLRLQRCRLS